MIEGLINKVDEYCQSFLCYRLEKEIIYNALVYMDIKNVLKKARGSIKILYHIFEKKSIEVLNELW